MALNRDKIYAYITDGDNDGIVVVGKFDPVLLMMMMIPLVSLGDPDKLAAMSEIAEKVARDSGKTVRLFEFTTAQELRVFTPDGATQ